MVAQMRVFLADDVQTQVMESGDDQAAGLVALDDAAHPFLHFPGGLVGEGDGGDVPSGNPDFLDQVGDLAGDHAGFPAAGPGQHQQGAVGVADRFALSGVELVHKFWTRVESAAEMTRSTILQQPATLYLRHVSSMIPRMDSAVYA